MFQHLEQTAKLFLSATIMEFLKILWIVSSVFCLQAESQNCTSTFTCPRTRGDLPPLEIECEKVCDFIPDCRGEEDEAQCGTSCTFDGDMAPCDWEAVTSDRYIWTLGSGILLNDQGNLGPPADRSWRNSTGGYLYVNEDGTGTAQQAELQTPTLHNTAERCAFSFYYHLSESNAWHLQVFLQTDYTTRLMKDIGSSSTSSRIWKRNTVTIGRVFGSAKVIIRASKLPGSSGAAAIDFISSRDCALAYDTGVSCASNEWRCDNGGCIPQDKLCDFVQHCRNGSDETDADCDLRNRCNAEVDFCNFTSSGDSSLQIVSASSAANRNWPFIDHTYMTPQGSYFAVNGSSRGTSRTVVLGPSFKGIPAGETECKMSFFYHLSGGSSWLSIGFRTLYSRVDQTPRQVSNSRVQSWNKYDFPFQSSTDFQPLFIADLEDAVLAIDDIIFSEGCVSAEPEVIYDQCTFEDDSMPLCSWEQEEEDGQLHWEVKEAREAGKMGALKLDHTDQDLKGHYLYLDSKEGHEGLSARLFSELYQPGSCQMILWYYLGGSNTNKLSVYTRTAATEGALQVKWREAGDQGHGWREAVIPINETSIFQIVIEGSAGTFTTHMDHVGVDDIGFNIRCVAAGEDATLPDEIDDDSDCSDLDYSCADGTCVLGQSGNCPMECNFDNDWCGWTNDVTAGNQWSLSGASIPVYGPTSDHTSQGQETGQFLFIDGKDKAPYQAAQLVSPLWPLNNLECKVSMWYYHFGYNYGSLAVGVKPDQGPVRDVYTLHSHESNYNEWLSIEADVPKCFSTFQILVTAQNSYGNLQHGGFALDDFSLTCSQPSCDSNLQCSAGGQCFTPSQKCDLTIDCCEDRSDEDECDDYNLCAFDNGDFCIWHVDSGDGIEWTIKPEKKKRDSHTDTGIPASEGSFVQAEFQDGIMGKTSTLYSYLMSSVDDKCELRFVYFTDSSVSLRVILREGLEEEMMEEVWKSSESGSWQRAVISLPSGKPFEVVFKASSDSSEIGVVGLDSTSFTPSCEITNEHLTAETGGSGLTAVIIFVVGILVCCALLIIMVISLKSRKKDYTLEQSNGPTNDIEEESKMM